jgi:23S rRNA pseudouridine1911/1915/1917 synthase
MPDQPVAIQSPDQQRRRPEPEPVDLAILHEDEALIVLDKPADIVVHPTYKNTSGTLLNGVLWRYRDRRDVQPGILTRLDKGTTGVVVIALNAEVHARMQRDGAAGRMTKEYLAFVDGTPEPPRGTISLPLARDPQDRRRVIVTEAGQRCETRYEVLGDRRGEPRRGGPSGPRRGGPSGPPTVIRCEFVTGRTHQIRVHLAAIGCPIVGDATYGQASDRIARQALHAWRVSLVHPVSQQRLTIEAPLPEDMRTIVNHEW